MGFKFRLQVVLDVALRVQDQKMQVMGEAERRHWAALEYMEQLRGEDASRRADLLAAQQAGAIDLQAVQWGLQWLETLKGRILAHQQVIAEAEQAVEAARSELMEAAREVQVLQKLEEKARRDYQQRLDRIEAQQIDELATLRHGRTEGLNFDA